MYQAGKMPEVGVVHVEQGPWENKKNVKQRDQASMTCPWLKALHTSS
jgi:hypothetical protein